MSLIQCVNYLLGYPCSFFWNMETETRKNKRHLSSFRCEIRDFFYKLKVIKTMNKILSVSNEDEKEIFR